jgi:hypothetical protein
MVRQVYRFKVGRIIFAPPARAQDLASCAARGKARIPPWLRTARSGVQTIVLFHAFRTVFADTSRLVDPRLLRASEHSRRGRILCSGSNRRAHLGSLIQASGYRAPCRSGRGATAAWGNQRCSSVAYTVLTVLFRSRSGFLGRFLPARGGCFAGNLHPARGRQGCRSGRTAFLAATSAQVAGDLPPHSRRRLGRLARHLVHDEFAQLIWISRSFVLCHAASIAQRDRSGRLNSYA